MKKDIILWFMLSAIYSHAHVQVSNAQTTVTQQNISPGNIETPETQGADNDAKVTQQVQVIQPGGVIYIRSPKFTASNYQSKLGQTKTIIIPRDNYDDIYAGVDINTIPGEYLLTIETEKKQLHSYPFIVPVPEEVNFIEQNLPIYLPEKSKTINKILWSNIPPKLPFIFPVHGNWSQSFGHYYEKSTLNKKQKNNKTLHRIDNVSIKIDSPTSIHSPSDAVCFLITFDETTGYTVLLDHGMGLFSEISGLSNLSISEQDRILKNALIANFNVDDFKGKNNKKMSRQINWRVFLNKSIVNPYQLTNIQ